MADEGFSIKGVVELVADEKSIEAVADDADRELAESRRGGTRGRPSPAAPGRPGAAREILAGAGGASLAKQIGGEFGKVQDKAAKGGRAISPVTAGIIASSLARRPGGAVEPAPADRGRRGAGATGAAVSAVRAGGLKSSILGILKSPPFLAAAALVTGALAVAALPKIADKRLSRLTGLPGAEFSPELSALALRRRIRQRERTIETGRIRGPSASALAMTTDESLDRLARIGAALGVGLDRILKFLIDGINPFLRTIEDVLRSLGLLPGTNPSAANFPVTLLFGGLRANPFNPAFPIPVRS